MNTQDKKKELQYILDTADEGLTNVLMEAAVEYQTKTTKEFVVPQEWIDEAERVSKAIDNGEMKTYSSEEFVAATKEYFKTKHNVNYTPNI